jgi:hypothetical protein
MEQKQPEQKTPLQSKDKQYVLLMLLITASLTISSLWFFWIQIPKVATAVTDKIGNYQGLLITTMVLVILDLMGIYGCLYLLREYRKRRHINK